MIKSIYYAKRGRKMNNTENLIDGTLELIKEDMRVSDLLWLAAGVLAAVRYHVAGLFMILIWVLFWFD